MATALYLPKTGAKTGHSPTRVHRRQGQQRLARTNVRRVGNAASFSPPTHPPISSADRSLHVRTWWWWRERKSDDTANGQSRRTQPLMEHSSSMAASADVRLTGLSALFSKTFSFWTTTRPSATSRQMCTTSAVRSVLSEPRYRQHVLQFGSVYHLLTSSLCLLDT